jgi:Tfp pilus assembly protein PilN
MIEINLLPKEMQIQGPRVALNRKMLVPALGALALVATMTSLTIYQKQQLGELDGKIRIARARAEQLQKDIQMVDALVAIKEKITDRINAVKVLDQNRTAWVNLMEDMSSRLPEFLWLTSVRQVMEPAAAPVAGRVPGDTANPTQLASGEPQTQFPAEIEGYAYSLSGLANLILNMRKSGHFKDVDLRTAREVELETHTAYSFALTCTLDYTGSANAPADLETGGPEEIASTSESTAGQNQESDNGVRP